MKRIIGAIGFGAMLAAVQPLSAQPENPAVIARQQLTQCMNRRMAADRTVSYNEALRTCKERLQPPKDTLASNTPAEAGNKSR